MLRRTDGLLKIKYNVLYNHKFLKIIMSENNSLNVGVFSKHQGAESAVKELQRLGYDMKKLSVIAKDYQTEENVVGYYNTRDRMAGWGKNGLFWGWVWGHYLALRSFLSLVYCQLQLVVRWSAGYLSHLKLQWWLAALVQ